MVNIWGQHYPLQDCAATPLIELLKKAGHPGLGAGRGIILALLDRNPLEVVSGDLVEQLKKTAAPGWVLKSVEFRRVGGDFLMTLVYRQTLLERLKFWKGQK